ncbi:hypothetical protein HIM_10326 [Hirsutella minnesotensis 3608]|uniref:Azaphilone pigments biosynthesis cluster protein L N-terminal domain-containing protein n=1 Tax=Hirsutella minnesotensis 3608 TaxID=1043627 RepID=A0A0F7ZX85_9HYPO|nr:hypothetical protein HIM_10326 [Hirsutella minnesotensis 3608]
MVPGGTRSPAVATAALQSARALYNVVDGLVDAPHSVSQSKSLLSQTQTTLGTLTQTLEANSASGAVGSVLEEIELSKALEWTESLCQAFTAAMTKFAGHSTDSHFSKRDRFVVYFNESEINRLNRDLADCQRTITMVLSSITLIVSSHTSGDIDQIRTRFEAQERALADLGAQLSTREAESRADDYGTVGEGDSSALILQEVCQKTLSATRAQRTGQKFGDMKTDNHSIAMQGIVGVAQPGVDQSFGSLTTTMSSRAFQGQMDLSSFGKLFAK